MPDTTGIRALPPKIEKSMLFRLGGSHTMVTTSRFAGRLCGQSAGWIWVILSFYDGDQSRDILAKNMDDRRMR